MKALSLIIGRAQLAALGLFASVAAARGAGAAEPAAPAPASPARATSSAVPGAQLPARVHMSVTREAGAESCPALDELEAAVEQRLGRPVFVARAAADLRVEVRARRAGRAFVIEADLFDASGRDLGRRRLSTRARHCSALDDSLALVLSLVADVARPAPREAPASAAPEPPPPPLATPLEIPETTLQPREPLRLRPMIGVDAGAGLLPGASLGIGLGVELVFPRFWPVRIGASYWGEQRVGATDSAEARFGLQTLRLGACPASFHFERFSLDLCAEQLLGRQAAQGFGFVSSSPGDRWVAAFGGGIGMKRWFGRSFIMLSGSLLASAVQRRYYFRDVGKVTLHDTSWVLGIGTIAVGFEL